MRLEQTDREVTHGGHGRTVQARIKASRKLFSFFSDGVYSNKPVAICRELVANAIDSHVAAGKGDVPVEVILPTELDPTFMVRDQGTGMGEAFIFDKYLVYAEGSTKDGSNEAIGGFGIGKAAVFSYVDQFSLVDVKDGVKCVYSVFIDEEGIPAITQVAKTTTDEGNGVAISFPVEMEDLTKFHEAAQQALQYFNPLPKVTNGTIDEPAYNYRGKNWMLRPQFGDLAVIMGGIRYPVAMANLSWDLRQNTKLSPLLSYGIDLVMPIGSCGVALSREALSYDAATSVNIQKALEGMIDDVIGTFKHMFDDCPTMWAAIVKLAKETGGATANTGRGKLLAANAFWNGVQISDHITVNNRMDICSCWMIEPVSYRRRHTRTVPNAKWENIAEQYHLYPGRIETVLVDDLPISPKSKTIKKIKAFVEATAQDKHTLVLRANIGNDDHTDPKAIRKMLKELGGPVDVTYTSSLPEPEEEEEADNGNGNKVVRVRPRIRMFRFNGKSDYHGNTITNLTPAWAKSCNGTSTEIEYKDQPATGIMVVMNNFELPADLAKKMETGVVGWDELYFINKADEGKVKDSFENFDDVFPKRLAAALAQYPELPQRIAMWPALTVEVVKSSRYGYESTKLDSWLKLVDSGLIKLDPAQERRPFGRLVSLWQQYVKPLDDKQRALQGFVKPAFPPRVNPAKLVAAFKTQQEDAFILLQKLDLKDAKHLALIAKHL